MRKRNFIVAALLASCLAIASQPVDAAMFKVHDCDDACRRMRDKNIELTLDEFDLQSDVGLLRRLMRRHASQKRIEMLRHLIQEDWFQIVMDRGHPVGLQPVQSNIADSLVRRSA
jgi:hypothetical protein